MSYLTYINLSVRTEWYHLKNWSYTWNTMEFAGQFWYTVEAWYKGRNGTFESVPLYQAEHLYQALVVLLPFSAQYHMIHTN